jgi:hypothetical protein
MRSYGSRLQSESTDLCSTCPRPVVISGRSRKLGTGAYFNRRGPAAGRNPCCGHNSRAWFRLCRTREYGERCTNTHSGCSGRKEVLTGCHSARPGSGIRERLRITPVLASKSQACGLSSNRLDPHGQSARDMRDVQSSRCCSEIGRRQRTQARPFAPARSCLIIALSNGEGRIAGPFGSKKK